MNHCFLGIKKYSINQFFLTVMNILIQKKNKKLHNLTNESSILDEKHDQLLNGEQYISTVLESKINENKDIHPRRIHSVNVDIRKTNQSSDENGEQISTDFSTQGSSRYNNVRRRSSTGKSTLILVVIVVFFVITHANRLALKLYMTRFPHLNTKENFTRCYSLGR